VAAGHHLGEAAHVAGEGIQVRAAVLDGGELVPFAGLEVFGPGQQPAGDLAGLGHRGGWRRRGGLGTEWADVAAHGLGAAAPALGLQLGVQCGGVGDALVPPLVDEGLERVEPGFPAGGLDQQLSMSGSRANRCTV